MKLGGLTIPVVKNTKDIWIVLGVLALYCSGCLRQPAREVAVVDLFQIPDNRIVETDHKETIQQLRSWIAEVLPGQLPPNKLGNVGPYVTVWVYRVQDDGRRQLISSNGVYAIDGGRTERKLVSDEKILRLKGILEEKGRWRVVNVK